MSNYAILLTACVNPNGMVYTCLQDSSTRQQQYIEALRFYLEHTKLPIVFCENTNTDFSNLFKKEIDKGRLEYLTFNGNDYDKAKGKGYGEAKIIIHAIEKSAILKSCNQIIKITGRLIIDNIRRIISSPFNRIPGIFRSNLENSRYFRTMIFIFEKSSFHKYLTEHIEEITDSGATPLSIEETVAKYVSEERRIIIPFFITPHITGISGMTNAPYANKSSLTNALDNTYHLHIMFNEGNRTFLGKSFQLLYILFLAIKKLTGKK